MKKATKCHRLATKVQINFQPTATCPSLYRDGRGGSCSFFETSFLPGAHSFVSIDKARFPAVTGGGTS
jgi:hypothetical protein